MLRLRMMRAPQKYVQGKDALLHFHEEMKDLGNRWLFICSHSGYQSCHDKIEESYQGKEDYRQYEIFGGVSSVGEIERMKKLVAENDINVVVGVGGGSAIDTAKATAYYAKLPVVIVPTVVATDAPCTGLSVIYNDDKTFNSYLFYPKNPEAVIVDSEIIAHAPVSLVFWWQVWEMLWELTLRPELVTGRTLPAWKTAVSPVQPWPFAGFAMIPCGNTARPQKLPVNSRW